jgi:hypothetical protein
MFREEIWKAIQKEIEEVMEKDKAITHVNISYQVRDSFLSENKAFLSVKLK